MVDSGGTINCGSDYTEEGFPLLFCKIFRSFLLKLSFPEKGKLPLTLMKSLLICRIRWEAGGYDSLCSSSVNKSSYPPNTCIWKRPGDSLVLHLPLKDVHGMLTCRVWMTVIEHHAGNCSQESVARSETIWREEQGNLENVGYLCSAVLG